MLKAVIFDIDGTLIDSVDLHAQSWLETFKRFGVQARFADVRRHIGEGADRDTTRSLPSSASATPSRSRSPTLLSSWSGGNPKVWPTYFTLTSLSIACFSGRSASQ